MITLLNVGHIDLGDIILAMLLFVILYLSATWLFSYIVFRIANSVVSRPRRSVAFTYIGTLAATILLWFTYEPEDGFYKSGPSLMLGIACIVLGYIISPRRK